MRKLATFDELIKKYLKRFPACFNLKKTKGMTEDANEQMLKTTRLRFLSVYFEIQQV